MHIVLIEHDEADLLYPFSLTHGAWELRAGVHRVIDRWRAALPAHNLHVHTHRTGILDSFQAREPHTICSYDGGPTLIMLANLIVSPAVMQKVVDLCGNSSKPVHFMAGHHTAGVFIPEHRGGLDEITSSIDGLKVEEMDNVHLDGHMITRLWQILDRIADGVRWDAELVDSHVAKSAVVHPTAVIDDTHGAVIIGERANIGAFCVLQGPVVLGNDCIVKPHAHITASVFGPHCRVSGEIANTIFHSHSNKQHSGFVGHSYVGQWVNMGAGTTTSNLKNTYSHVRPTFPWGREDSQRMFLGSLIGDHTRTAIGTMLPTGGVYGACTAIFTTSPAPASMRSFSWDGQRYELAKAIGTARVVMSRRSVELTPAEEHLLSFISEHDAPGS